MSEQNDNDLKRTQDLFSFLQGQVPDRCIVPRGHMPKLTPDQAWTVIWWLGNQCWQVTDRVERCDVCGDLFHGCQEGRTLDFGKAPYSFCDNCMEGEIYARKSRKK